MAQKVVITSIKAGGGHKTAMYSIGSILSKFSPDVKYEYFISDVEDMEQMHHMINIYTPALYDVGYKLSDLRIFQRIINFFTTIQGKKIQAELEQVLSDPEVKVVISTHFMQTAGLLAAKKKLKTDTKIIAYVPDFDEVLVHFPRLGGMLPDGMIAQSPSLLKKIERKYGISQDMLQVGGYMTREEFTNARKISYAEAREKLSKLNFPGAIRLDPHKLTITVNGGSNWVSKIFDEIEELVKSTVIDWSNAQILIVCGNNNYAYKKFMELKGRSPGRTILALPFIPYEHMSLVFRATDLMILASIAPATMYEYLELGAGPIVVHRTNPGQEKDNLRYAIDNGIAHYIPNNNDLIHFIERYQQDTFWSKELQEQFSKIANSQRTIARENAKQSAKFIQRILKENI